MKKVITEEEKDEFCVKAHNNIDLLKRENKLLNINLQQNCNDLKQLENNYDRIREDYRQICLLQIGKGKYYQTSILPTQIKSRIDSLKSDSYDHYALRENEKKVKEVNLLIPILKEDLEKAEEEERKLEEFIRKTEEEYVAINFRISYYRKEIKKIEKKIFENLSRIKYLLEQISRVDDAYENSKKINIDRLVLKLQNQKNKKK